MKRNELDKLNVNNDYYSMDDEIGEEILYGRQKSPGNRQGTHDCFWGKWTTGLNSYTINNFDELGFSKIFDGNQFTA